MKRERSSDGTGSIGYPVVATEARQSSASEVEERNVAETPTETLVQTATADTTADHHSAPAEAPVTTDAKVVEAADNTAQSEEARETNLAPAEGESSHVDDTDGGGETNWHKDAVPRADEGELGLPFVATDITFVTCRAGEKVTRRALGLIWMKYTFRYEIVATTVNRLELNRGGKYSAYGKPRMYELHRWACFHFLFSLAWGMELVVVSIV